MTHLHKISLKLRFLHVELKNPFCRAQSVLHFAENQKSVLFFYLKLWNLKTAKTSNLKAYNMYYNIKAYNININIYLIMRKWPLKKKNHISTSFK